MLFLGDSITEGYGLSDIEKVYWKRFRQNDGCSVFGYGHEIIYSRLKEFLKAL